MQYWVPPTPTHGRSLSPKNTSRVGPRSCDRPLQELNIAPNIWPSRFQRHIHRTAHAVASHTTDKNTESPHAT